MESGVGVDSYTLISAASFFVWLTAVVSAVRTPERVWQAADASRPLWLGLLAGSFIGSRFLPAPLPPYVGLAVPMAYWTMIRFPLVRAQSQLTLDRAASLRRAADATVRPDDDPASDRNLG